MAASPGPPDRPQSANGDLGEPVTEVLSEQNYQSGVTIPFVPDRTWSSIERHLRDDTPVHYQPPSGLEPPEWTYESNCLGAPDEWFYGDPNKRPALTRDMATWVRDVYCSPCAVRAQCLTAAFRQNEPAGIWGGFTKRGRDNIRKMIKSGQMTMEELIASLTAGEPLPIDPEEDES